MNAYSALSGFGEEDMPLFREKLHFLAPLASSTEQENRFQRVLSISGLARFVANSGERINVGKLLEVRASAEAREFRDWLATIDTATDEEVRDRVTGLNAKLGLLVHGSSGKAMRFLIGFGAALVPGYGSVLGTAVGAIDQFLLEKIVRRSGIAAFVSESYPSLFEK